MMDKLFHISERGSTVQTEIRAGFTTFLAMAYIIAVNPSILQAAGIPFNAALTATCFGAALMTIIMGIFANRPLALASGMGINAMVAFALCGDMGVDWRIAMSVVFIEGVVILLLVLVGIREAIMRAIPSSLRKAIGVGLGLFIAFIGLKSGNLIVANESTLITMGHVKDPVAIVSIVSLTATILLHALKVKGGLLWGIIIAVLVGIPLGVTPMPQFHEAGLDFSTFAAPFQTVPGTDQMALVTTLLNPVLVMFAFSLLMSDFFDTMGTIVAVGKQGKFIRRDGTIENIRSMLTVDSVAAAVGGFTGASSITTYVESSAGATDGARTGLSSIVVGILFIIAAFFSPFISMVTGASTCGALVFVGYLMMSGVGDIDWDNLVDALPAFLTIIGIPLTYSIANGIGLGFISYVLVCVFTGRIRDVKPLMWVAAFAFLVSFLIM